MVRTLSSHFTTANLVRSLSVGVACSLTLAFQNEAFGQLRTGRHSSRDFYSTNRASSEATSPTIDLMEVDENEQVEPASTAGARSSGVVPAAAVGRTAQRASTTKSLVNKPTTRPRAVDSEPATEAPRASRPTSSVKSSVVQAGCKNCQAGVAHSHPIAMVAESMAHEDVAYEDEPRLLSDDMYDPHSMQLGSGCDECGSSTCGPDGCDMCSDGMHPMPILRVPLPFGGVLTKIHARVEAATYYHDGEFLPALVRTGDVGAAGSQNLFGGEQVFKNATQGLRGEIGTYFGPRQRSGVLLRFFNPSASTLTYGNQNTPNTQVVRPYNDGTAQTSISINETGISTGQLLATTSSEVYGGDILFRQVIGRNPHSKWELLAGYQTLRLQERLKIDSTTVATNGNQLDLTDSFLTTNRFNGAAFGLSGITHARHFSVSGMFKMGLGNMERNVDIHGNQRVTVPGVPPSVNASSNGLLARSTNDGNYSSNTFVVTPEFNVTLGYRLTRNLEATVGYTYLQMPKVARVADQLDPGLVSNLSNPLVGASRPSFSLLESNYWLSSVNYGLQYRY